jgi:hypothetical protein
MTQIFKCLAGSRLYGTNTANSDHDYKAVHLPTKREILLGKRDTVRSTSTGSKETRNGADDVDVESFELQRFLQLASDMQTIPVELLFVKDSRGDPDLCGQFDPIWGKIRDNMDKILNNNTKAFVGYCKGQAVRYSMRGKRLETYESVCTILNGDLPVVDLVPELLSVEGVKIVDKEQPGGRIIPYLDVYGRQCPVTIKTQEALRIYLKPVEESGRRARDAMNAGGMGCKAMYHAVRIADEGISLFQTGSIEFPCTNLPFLMKIRAGEVHIDELLDVFDEKIEILQGIGEKSPLSAQPDRVWIDDFVSDVYEDIVRA